MSCFAPLILFSASLALLQPAARPSVELAPPPRPAGSKADTGAASPLVRHALILCGHPGDEEHAASFAETIGKISEGLAKTAGIPTERQYVVFGDEVPKDIPGAKGPATRETVVAEVAGVRKIVKDDEGLWVICLGHGHHDGRRAWWNLPGPDMNAADFGKLFADFNCREQVFILTSSLSGYFVAPLAKRDRVVVAATEADEETNETTFPGVFAQFLAAGLDPAEHDIDQDGKLTLFDLYVVIAKEIAQSYATAEQLATEHSQLDDDADGVGHEVQSDYLPEEQGGTPAGAKKSRRPHRDGARAVHIMLLPGK